MAAGDIQLSANFDLRTSKALDGRTVVTTLSERNSLPFAYPGIAVFVLSTGKRYTLLQKPATNAANWQQEGAQTKETTLTVTNIGQTLFSLPAGITVISLHVNGMRQEAITDWQQTGNSLEWLSTDFALHPDDNLQIQYL